MHNLAISLRRAGHNVTGSDDEIFEPAYSSLKNEGLLPEKIGWDPSLITAELDVVVLGMHAKGDNPELLRAKELGLTIRSFPAFVADQVQNKTRVVIAGSHGKTTITSMLMHILKECGMEFDYLVGSKVEGFDLTVKLTEKAKVVLIEGDEYLSSALEPIPKFHLYKPHIALITGIAWDHINVFPTFDNYTAQFALFVDTIEPNGKLVYNLSDPMLRQIALHTAPDLVKIPYSTPNYEVKDGKYFIIDGAKRHPMSILGKHNMENLEGARNVCNALGIKDADLYKAVSTFTGAAKRLEVLVETDDRVVYRDFAHSPSKLKATTAAAKEQYPDRKLVAVMELHTYSSLSKQFLSEYKGAMDAADVAVVYFDSHAIELKRLPEVSVDDVLAGFKRKDLIVLTNKDLLADLLAEQQWDNSCLLLMSSGNFGGIDLDLVKQRILVGI